VAGSGMMRSLFPLPVADLDELGMHVFHQQIPPFSPPRFALAVKIKQEIIPLNTLLMGLFSG
jgi:hypothetical protein